MITDAILDIADHAYHGGPPGPNAGPLELELRAIHRADLRRALIAGARALYLAEADRLRQGPHSTLAMVVATYSEGLAAELALATLTACPSTVCAPGCVLAANVPSGGNPTADSATPCSMASCASVAASAVGS